MGLQGQVALVAGEASNACMETASSLADHGVHLALHFEPSTSRRTALMAQDLHAHHPNVRITTHLGRLSNADEIDALFADVKRKQGGLDMVVNSNGRVLSKLTAPACEADIEKMLAYHTFIDAQALAHEKLYPVRA